MNANELKEFLYNNVQFKELWLEHESGSSLCLLVNGDIGLLMYLRSSEDSGYTTRNESCSTDELVKFKLNNGQVDEYPKNWTYSVSIVEQVALEFVEKGNMSSLVGWQEDMVF